jgi:hypothetical protein
VYSERRRGGDTMITRKHLLLAIAATCLLTMFAITIVPIRSQTAGQYDPWLDINDDGVIDGLDLIQGARAFGTAGDPTKPVTVTNLRDYELQTGTVNFSSSYPAGTFIPTIFCGGYSRISILFAPNLTNLGNGRVTVYLVSVNWTQEFPLSSPAVSSDFLYSNINTTISAAEFGWPTAYVTETKAPYCHLCFYALVDTTYPPPPANWWVAVNYAGYLRNE